MATQEAMVNWAKNNLYRWIVWSTVRRPYYGIYTILW